MSNPRARTLPEDSTHSHSVRSSIPALEPSPIVGESNAAPHRRRPRYRGKHPRHFAEKYKEHDPAKFSDTVSKVLASGKTPAGMHRPILVAEVLNVLRPEPGEIAADCTLGYGGHAMELLRRLAPTGKLIGLDADPVELPKTEARLRKSGFGEEVFIARRSNFAGLPQQLATLGHLRVDCLLADLGVSSMQLDDPARGFSLKCSGPLDMRMNPQRGYPASALLEKSNPADLEAILAGNADEPRAKELAVRLAGRRFESTVAFAKAIRESLPRLGEEEVELTVRRVFQAVRVAVNEEFSALESLLRHLPSILNPGGRAAILTFHSGEDRRVKKAFEAGKAAGFYSEISAEVIRATAEERRENPRSSSAKLRWAMATAP